MSAPSQQRFLTAFEEYLNAVVVQAKDRSRHRIRDIQSYLELRRNTIGAKPSFAIMEAEMNLPEEVIKHPVMVELTNLTIDLLCIGNVSIPPQPRLVTSQLTDKSLGLSLLQQGTSHIRR